MYSRHGTRPRITNITFTDGTTEQSHIFYLDVKQFSLIARNNKPFRFSWMLGGTSTAFQTVPANASYFEDYIKDTLTIYLLVPTATIGSPEVIEILEWESTD